MLHTHFDKVMSDLVDYAYDETRFDKKSMHMARFCLMDAIGCAIVATGDKDCSNLLNNIQFSKTDNGVPIIGSKLKLGPIEAAFHIGSLIRWVEFNDTWLAQEWGHPSDNLGAILSAATWKNLSNNKSHKIRMGDILNIIIRTYEIHGSLCLSNCFNILGIDHVILVKIASTIAAAKLLGLSKELALNALSNTIIDGHSLRTYRHSPNTGTRKSWAAGDATARGLQFALFAQAGEMGYPTALSAPKWGFNDTVLKGKEFNISFPLSDSIINNILFKVPNPAEYHAQTAVEAAIRLHSRLKENRLSLSQIEYIRVETQLPAMKIIDKSGHLNNSADRDHCIQYMIAVAIITGDLTIKDFHEPLASDTRINSLREKIKCIERQDFTKNYNNPSKRGIPNALYLKLRNIDGELYEIIEYPLGHSARRHECFPALIKKFSTNLSNSYSQSRADELSNIILSETELDEMLVGDFLELFTLSNNLDHY